MRRRARARFSSRRQATPLRSQRGDGQAVNEPLRHPAAQGNDQREDRSRDRLQRGVSLRVEAATSPRSRRQGILPATASAAATPARRSAASRSPPPPPRAGANDRREPASCRRASRSERGPPSEFQHTRTTGARPRPRARVFSASRWTPSSRRGLRATLPASKKPRPSQAGEVGTRACASLKRGLDALPANISLKSVFSCAADGAAARQSRTFRRRPRRPDSHGLSTISTKPRPCPAWLASGWPWIQGFMSFDAEHDDDEIEAGPCDGPGMRRAEPCAPLRSAPGQMVVKGGRGPLSPSGDHHGHLCRAPAPQHARPAILIARGAATRPRCSPR